MKLQKKNDMGITLIALLITLIVLLIIAGITISAISGTDGIINGANDSKSKTAIVEEKQILNTSVAASIGKSPKAKVEEANLKNYCNQNIGKEDEDYTLEKEDKHFNLKFSSTGNEYVILEDGTILTKQEYNSKIETEQKGKVIVEVGEKEKVTIETESESLIEWKSKDEGIAKVNVDETRNVKEADILGIKNGETTITATLKNGETVQYEVVVKTSPKSISLNKTNITLDLSIESQSQKQLVVSYDPITTNANKKITWASSDTSVATVSTSGLVTGVKNGNIIITATTENGKTATCSVTVQTTPTSVTLDKTNVTLDLNTNKTVQLKATVNPSTANVQNGITWKSNNTSIATVSTSGLVTGVKNGSTTIIATTGNGKTATCTITVQTTPTSVTLNKTNVTLDMSGTKTVQLTATVNPGTANIQNGITWKSNNTSVATVSASGLVTGIKNGSTTITATTTNGKSTTCTITVQTTPTSVTLNQTNVTLDMSGTKTVQLTATVNPSTANVQKGITWKSNNTSIATVSQSGLVTGIKNGSTTITATTANEKTATCTITVQTTPTSVTLNRTSATLDLSGTKTIQLTATVNPSTANVQKGITWKSNNTSIATVSTSGLVTGIKNGSTTITATTANGKTATCTIGVETRITSLTLTAPRTTMETGSTMQLTAKVVPTSTTESLTWSSSNTNVATVSQSGVVTGRVNGTVRITVKSSTTGKTASVDIKVQTSPNGITLNRSSVTLDLSGTKTVQLTATLTPNTVNANNGVTWKSNNTSVATVSASGLVTGIKNGSTTITATTTNGKSTTCTITVQTNPTSVTLNRTSATLDLSGTKTVQLTATVNPNTANINKGVTWRSNDTSIATVSTSGVVTGVRNGSTTITVTTGNGKTATCAITVQTTPTSVTLNKTSATLNLSGTKTVQLTATVNPRTANVQNGVTWKSSNTSVATVSASGLVTGVKNGSTTITATTGNGKSTTCTITVITTITSIKLNYTTASLQEGNTLQLNATINPTSTTETVTWYATNSCASVTQSGLVTAKAGGSVNVVAKNPAGTITATCTITINYAPRTFNLTEKSRRGEGDFEAWSDTIPAGAKYAVLTATNKLIDAWRDRTLTWKLTVGSETIEKAASIYLDGSFGNNPEKTVTNTIQFDGTNNGSTWKLYVHMSAGQGVGFGSSDTLAYSSGSITFYYK